MQASLTDTRHVAAVCVALILLAAGCGSGQTVAGESAPLSPRPSTSSVDESKTVAMSEYLSEKANQVAAYCREHFPQHYTQVSASLPSLLIVHRKPGSDLDGAVRARFPNVSIQFRDARYSARELETLVLRINYDVQYWKDRGITIYGVGPETDGSGVRVDTPDPHRARQPLIDRYGDAVRVQRGGPFVFLDDPR